MPEILQVLAILEFTVTSLLSRPVYKLPMGQKLISPVGIEPLINPFSAFASFNWAIRAPKKCLPSPTLTWMDIRVYIWPTNRRLPLLEPPRVFLVYSCHVCVFTPAWTYPFLRQRRSQRLDSHEKYSIGLFQRERERWQEQQVLEVCELLLLLKLWIMPSPTRLQKDHTKRPLFVGS